MGDWDAVVAEDSEDVEWNKRLSLSHELKPSNTAKTPVLPC